MKLRSILLGCVCLLGLAFLPAALFAASVGVPESDRNRDSAPRIANASAD